MVRAHRSLDLIESIRLSALWILSAALLYLVWAAVWSTSVRTLGSHPNPTRDYESAMKLAEAFQHTDTAVAAGGESIVLVHGHRTPRAFVLFHGLTNSPRQFKRLAAILYDSGDNVFVPRLPRHALRGATSSELGRLTAESLRNAADAAIDVASGLGDTVVVLGLSLGGDMAAWAAQFRPVSRVVIVAPALGLTHMSTAVETLIMNLMLRLPNYSRKGGANALRPDRELGWSTRGVGQMLRLSAAIRRAADNHPPAARDIRVLVNANDRTVNRHAIDELVEHWSAAGGHVSMFELADTLRLPHDIVDPDELTGNTRVTYPVILSLLYGSTPPASLGVRVIRPSQHH